MTLEDVLKRIREHILTHPEDAQKQVWFAGPDDDFGDWTYYKDLVIDAYSGTILFYGDGDPA